MKWLRELIDRWRRGPELRARQALVHELEGQLEQAAQENVRGAGAYVDVLQQRAELIAFVRSGHVKARCRYAGCGDLTFDFSLHRVTIGDGQFALVAICGSCGRRLKREQEKALAEAAPDGAALQAPPEPAVAAEA